MHKRLMVTALTAALLGANAATAAPVGASKDLAGQVAKPTLVAYKPPLRGAPLSRIGGGTRSIQARDLEIEVLAPEHTGLTLRPQPVLYWFASKSVTAPVEFTLVRPGVPEPLLEVALDGPFEAGIHAIDLSRYVVRLDPEIDYEWFVSVVFDPAQRSSDATAGGGIRLLGADDGRRRQLAGASSAGDFAQAGVWYDAIASLSAGDDASRRMRAALLSQVGLGATAAAPD